MCEAFFEGGPLNNVGGGRRAVVVLFWPSHLGRSEDGEWLSTGVSICGIFRVEPAMVSVAESYSSRLSIYAIAPIETLDST